MRSTDYTQKAPDSGSLNLALKGYQVLSCIGQGGTAKVYSGLCERTQKRVAIKVFTDPSVAHSPYFLREQRTLASLQHPGIVTLHESLLDQTTPAIAFELVEGCDLSVFQTRLPYILPELGVWIVVQVLKALEHAHAKNIIHRDLKPSNILISNSGEVKVTDFGLAKLVDSSSVTATGAIVGSPDYMSPEQAQGDLLSTSSDLFSITSVLYFLVTGVPPFSKSSSLATLSAVSRAEFEPAHRKNPKVSWELSRIIEKGLARDPHCRFESATDYRKALTRYLQMVGLMSSDSLDAPDDESFSLPLWLQDPSSRTIEYLKLMGETLLQGCDAAIRAANPDLAFEKLSHLSLIAPTSPSIERLQTRISSLQHDLEVRKRRSRILFTGIPAACLIMGAVFGVTRYRNFMKHRHELAVVTPAAPVALATPAAQPSVLPIAPANIQPERPERELAEKKAAPEPSKGTKFQASGVVYKAHPKADPQPVKFDLPESARAFWDDKIVEPTSEFLASPGFHRLKLIFPGSKPFEQRIKVIRGEPTLIRVHSTPKAQAGEAENEQAGTQSEGNP